MCAEAIVSGTCRTISDILGNTDSGEQLTHKHSPTYPLEWTHVTFQFHTLVLKVLLVLYCMLNPSHNPTRKSQVQLNLANMEGIQHFLLGPSTGLRNCHQRGPLYDYGNVGIPCLATSKFHHIHIADEMVGTMDTSSMLR